MTHRYITSHRQMTAPRTFGWVVRDSRKGGVDVDVDDFDYCVGVLGARSSTRRRLSLSNELHVLSRLRFEDRELYAFVPSPGSVCDLLPASSFHADQDLVFGNLSTIILMQERTHAEVVHISHRVQVDDDVVLFTSSAALAAPVSFCQSILCILAPAVFFFPTLEHSTVNLVRLSRLPP